MTTDPKKGRAAQKATLATVPMTSVYLMGLAHLDGADKYGPFNWRKTPVGTTTHLEAAKRHIQLYEAGEECAGDSGVPHLAHAMASLAILLDAKIHGTLVDERTHSDKVPGFMLDVELWRSERKLADAECEPPRPFFPQEA